jgi:hypothetical protein
LASAVQEAIAGLLAWRAANLEQGLRNMLAQGSVPAAGDIINKFYDHRLIRTLYKEGSWPHLSRASRPLKRKSRGPNTPWKNGRLPSYISPRSFALALMDTVAPNARKSENGTVSESHDLIAKMRKEIKGAGEIPNGAKDALISLLDDARGDIDAFRQRLEAWFDDTMARASGWYKRKAQLVLCILAAFIAVGLNANTLTIGERLWKDPAVRAAVVEQATSPEVTGQTPGKDAKERLNNAANNVDDVAKLGIPIGWTSDESDPRHVDFGDNWIPIVGGWFLTFAAISLGAPFWFDTLSRLSRLRNSGKPETPLPASGRGQPDERVRAQSPPVNVAVNVPPTQPPNRSGGFLRR